MIILDLTELNQTIYHVSEEGSVKNKIIKQLENLIEEKR